MGLLGWLAALEHQAAAGAPARLEGPGEAAVALAPRAVSRAFQIGFIDGIGPFLAYPASLWWFSSAWKTMAAGPAGAALVADYPIPFAVLFTSDWPRSMTEFAGLCARAGTFGLFPYSASYLAVFEGARKGGHRPVGGPGDLDLGRGCSLVYGLEATWLHPLLQRPLAA